MNKTSKIIQLSLITILVLILGGAAYIYSVINSGSQKNLDSSQGQSNSEKDITPSPTLTPTAKVKSSVSPTATPTGQAKVFFSKDPDSLDKFSYAEYRLVNTDRSDVENFVIEQSIQGPTEAQKTEGLFTPIKLNGDSNCSGKDFTLKIEESTKTATLKFCKQLELAGIGDDGRVKSIVDYDLKQFPTIEKTVILTKDDNCLGDQSGLNKCK